MSIFVGTCTAMVTPFDEKGVNYKAYEKQLEYQLENGISAILAAGSTGEPATMSEDEKKGLLEFTIKEGERKSTCNIRFRKLQHRAHYSQFTNGKGYGC